MRIRVHLFEYDFLVTSVFQSDGGIVVSMVAFQAVDPGSIPGHRTFKFSLGPLRNHVLLWC